MVHFHRNYPLTMLFQMLVHTISFILRALTNQFTLGFQLKEQNMELHQLH